MEYKYSKERREKMSLAKKKFFANGGTVWNKSDIKKKCESCGNNFKVIPSRLQKAKFCSVECAKGHNVFGKGSIPWNKGKTHLRGERHWNWQGGIDVEHTRIKQTKEYKDWQQGVYKKDKWTCQHCGYKGKSIVAHHIKLFSRYPELRFEIKNGMVLCRKCHQLVHNPRKKNAHKNN